MKSLGALGIALSSVALAVFAACSADEGGATVSATDDAGDGSASTTDGATPDGDAAARPKDDAATETPTDGGADAGADADAAVDAGLDANDGAPPAVNGCTTFTDHTGQNAVSIPWDFGIATSVDRCIVINAGTSVTFSGSVSSHPLKPQGGDVPTPITSMNAGSDPTIVFPNAGTYGYVCGFHPFMNGAIKVVP